MPEHDNDIPELVEDDDDVADDEGLEEVETADDELEDEEDRKPVPDR